MVGADFWARWGVRRDRSVTLRNFIGPELPLSRWASPGECEARWDEPSSSRHEALRHGEFPAERHIEDLCLRDRPPACAGRALGYRDPYAELGLERPTSKQIDT